MDPFVDDESGELLVDRIVDSIQDEQPIHDILSHITQSFALTY